MVVEVVDFPQMVLAQVVVAVAEVAPKVAQAVLEQQTKDMTVMLPTVQTLVVLAVVLLVLITVPTHQELV